MSVSTKTARNLAIHYRQFLTGVREMQAELMVRAMHEGGMRVRTSAGQFDVVMDYPLENGDPMAGPTPLTMLLASLAACSLNSMMMVLKKMQQPLTGLELEAHATRSTEHPTVLREISLAFTLKGNGIDAASAERALRLSEERFCPVWNMLKASTSITAEIHMEQPASATPSLAC